MVGKTGMSAGRQEFQIFTVPSGHLIHTAISELFNALTEFDRKARGELHLNKLPEFIKVLEGCNHLQNIQ